MDVTNKSLLHTYQEHHAPKASETVDSDVRSILIWAIYDSRSGEWVHDFLVEQKRLPDAKDSKTVQVRKVQRWRAAIEREIGLPRRPQGGATPLYQAMRQTWERTNPRPTLEQLQNGWTPLHVDYSQFDPTPSPTPKPVVQAVPPKSDPAPAVQTSTPAPAAPLSPSTPVALASSFESEPETVNLSRPELAFEAKEMGTKSTAEAMHQLADDVRSGTLKITKVAKKQIYVGLPKPRAQTD